LTGEEWEIPSNSLSAETSKAPTRETKVGGEECQMLLAVAMLGAKPPNVFAEARQHVLFAGSVHHTPWSCSSIVAVLRSRKLG